MMYAHLKQVRRRLLEILYERYQHDPLEMLLPQDFLSDGISREDLIRNMHYLADRKLVELMMGYAPPLFSAVRITADGIDLVENPFEFSRRFPPAPESSDGLGELPRLVEQLVEEADFSPLDREERGSLLREVQFLRDEVARPAGRWRLPVIREVLAWIESHFDKPDDTLPSVAAIREIVNRS